jgi:hypothetical protein
VGRTTVPVTLTEDIVLHDLVRATPGYPGPTEILDAADRAWLRAQGVAVPERVTVPGHVAATNLIRGRPWSEKRRRADQRRRAKKT